MAASWVFRVVRIGEEEASLGSGRNIYSANISPPEMTPLPWSGPREVSSNPMRRIDLWGPELRFAAAHFVTFGEECEALHGHNYAVGVEVEGDVTSESWLVDFGELRRVVAGVCGELDHAFLLPTGNQRVGVERAEGHYQVTFGGRRYVIPEADVRPLPIDNSTAERLAEWLAGRIAQELRARGAANLSSLTITVEEAPGQSASFTLPLHGIPTDH